MSKSVLVVDDIDDMRYLVVWAIGNDDRFDVVAEAADGATAVDLARDHQPDVVLLDLEMPWMSGAECLPLIRRAAPGAVVVIWTVEPTGRRAASALELGAVAVLDKAHTPASVVPDRLAALLDESHPGGGHRPA